MIDIEVLYFEGCPHHPPTTRLVREAISALGLDVELREVEVKPDDDFAALRFAGSPTVLVNGIDIEPDARGRTDYGYSCRAYPAGSGVPSRALIEGALMQVHSGDRSKRRSGVWTSVGAVGSAVVASACCWLPLLLLVFGVSASGVAGFFETTRPIMLVAAAVFLGLGFYLAYFRGRRGTCGPGETCAVPNVKLQRFNHSMLWVASVLVIIFAFFGSYSPALIRAFAESPSATVESNDSAPTAAPAQTIKTYHIAGMTCSGCAVGLQLQLSKLAGVTQADVSFDDSTATIRSAPGELSDEIVHAAIERSGFKLAP